MNISLKVSFLFIVFFSFFCHSSVEKLGNNKFRLLGSCHGCQDTETRSVAIEILGIGNNGVAFIYDFASRNLSKVDIYHDKANVEGEQVYIPQYKVLPLTEKESMALEPLESLFLESLNYGGYSSGSPYLIAAHQVEGEWNKYNANDFILTSAMRDSLNKEIIVNLKSRIKPLLISIRSILDMDSNEPVDLKLLHKLVFNDGSYVLAVESEQSDDDDFKVLKAYDSQQNVLDKY
ncbi:hypothetical protein CWC29_006375 [Pseudoalteromonas sp. S4498]|uniref:hypothetical protein n=1 Tax=Pseudoalteromonas galatheae TaxID=579562 RepID=UPI0011097AC9|nr:hypothetical protein [Pseudoalteromonas galatheae]NKC18469.1 hypothetical protein [Pseudoalteromonas galatheae]